MSKTITMTTTQASKQGAKQNTLVLIEPKQEKKEQSRQLRATSTIESAVTYVTSQGPISLTQDFTPSIGSHVDFDATAALVTFDTTQASRVPLALSDAGVTNAQTISEYIVTQSSGSLVITPSPNGATIALSAAALPNFANFYVYGNLPTASGIDLVQGQYLQNVFQNIDFAGTNITAPNPSTISLAASDMPYNFIITIADIICSVPNTTFTVEFEVRNIGTNAAISPRYAIQYIGGTYVANSNIISCFTNSQPIAPATVESFQIYISAIIGPVGASYTMNSTPGTMIFSAAISQILNLA